MVLIHTYIGLVACGLFVYSLHGAEGARYKFQPNQEFSLTWEIVDGYVDFITTAKTPGWIGLALNYRPRMNGADMVIGGVENGNNYLYVSYLANML
jgi:hypothetical protein